jgi:bromodomain and WD repeat domain containing protein 1/3
LSNSTNFTLKLFLFRSRKLDFKSDDWRINCRDLLLNIWGSSDGQPFRQPVDLVEHPDYLQVVETPMDLQTVREELHSGNYESPMDFAKDMRLIFQNSRRYNTNKQSRVS